MARRLLLALGLLGSVACGRKADTPKVPAAREASPAHQGHGDHPPLPEGQAEVTVDRTQMEGVKLGRVERTRLGGSVRASATIQADETREAHVHTKLPGTLQQVFVSAVGQKVRRGTPLYALYSQELFATEQEYLLARKDSPSLAESARKRLQLWDIPEDQIQRIEREGAQKTLVVRAPLSGTVVEKGALQGHYVEPGTMLYHIQDLSRVWVLAEVYENDVERLQPGAQADVQVQGLEQPLRARIDYTYPTVDPTTRTVKVRLVVDNAAGKLRPGGFATVELPVQPSEGLSVPEEAVVDTGLRQVVYLHLGEGRFRPVQVKVGRRGEGRAEIREGLKEGDEVAVSAQFLLDSESRLKGTTGQPSGHEGHGAPANPPAGHQGH